MKMSKTIPALALLSMSATVASMPAQAIEPEVSADIGVASQYVWRGAVQKGATAVQGDVGVSVGGFSASAWFSNSYASPDPQTLGKEVTEFDFTGDYSFSVGDLGVSLGGIYYTYMYDSHSNFVEAYAGLSYDAVVSPSVTVYYTARGVKSGFYKAGDIWVDAGLSGSAGGFDLSGTVSFVSWKKDLINRPVVGNLDTYKNGISLVQLGISKDVEVGGITMTPGINFSIPLIGQSSDGNHYIYGAPAYNEFIASVNFAY